MFAAAGLMVFLSATPAMAIVGGDTAPIRVVSGSETTLSDNIDDIAIGPASQLYVADGGVPAIDVFAAHTSGNIAPVRRIAGSNTQLVDPYGMAFDSAGDLYVSSDDAILIFKPNASGNEAPFETISGSNTTLAAVRGIAIDAAGQLWVTESDSNSIVVFAAGAHGDVLPVKTITGAATGLDDPFGIVIDPVSEVYVVNEASSAVTEYSTDASGNAAPDQTVGGSNTGFGSAGSDDIQNDAIGPQGQLVVANSTDNDVLTFQSAVGGDATPVDTLQGTDTQLDAPTAVAYDPAEELYTANNAGTPAITEYGTRVDSITPGSGPVAGGTLITITGAGFCGATYVQIDGKRATDVVFVSSSEVTAQTPPNAEGTFDVLVVSPCIGSDETHTFTYDPSLATTGVDPTVGLLTGAAMFAAGGVATVLARRRTLRTRRA